MTKGDFNPEMMRAEYIASLTEYVKRLDAALEPGGKKSDVAYLYQSIVGELGRHDELGIDKAATADIEFKFRALQERAVLEWTTYAVEEVKKARESHDVKEIQRCEGDFSRAMYEMQRLSLNTIAVEVESGIDYSGPLSDQAAVIPYLRKLKNLSSTGITNDADERAFTSLSLDIIQRIGMNSTIPQTQQKYIKEYLIELRRTLLPQVATFALDRAQQASAKDRGYNFMRAEQAIQEVNRSGLDATALRARLTELKSQKKK